MANSESTVNVGVGREGVHMDFRALVPFSGAYSPEQVRGGMSGPRLGGHPSIIWRKTTIYHSNQDGSYCLYARAEWRGNVGACWGFLRVKSTTGKRRQTVGPTGYGFHATSRATSGENGNIRRPLGANTSVMRREPATRLHRHNPLVPSEPAAVGAGTRRTVARRERRERLRAHHPMAQPPTTTSTVVEANGIDQSSDNNIVGEDDGPPSTPQPTIIIYNSNMGGNTGGQATSQMATLNLSDEES
ncbi:unnamed protein product [Adineta ricciae]|uniref:Uncharacterized protein n=1 Tax=Adineta ricciae TaxID=249248 RepID=A0A816H9D9_ADIRI|nr:unnamed protein product [Adineta ricciae]